MNTTLEIGPSASEVALAGAKGDDGRVDTTTAAFAELERSIYAALETYSNVHRGSGQHSMVSTLLYEQAREIVLAYLGLSKADHAMIFSTPRRADLLAATLAPSTYQRVASADLGLPLGVVALAVVRKALPKGVPFQTGGGTAKLVAPNWVLWAKAPDIFEPGTPAIVNIIAFARALQITQELGKDAFRGANVERRAAKELLWHDDLEGYAGLELLDQLRQTLIGRDARVPTIAGVKPFINLDNGASTPTFRPIWEVVAQTWRLPTPVYGEIVDEVKAICATVLGARSQTMT
ncbi:MAG: aminotransferase class V-fold PLP-dependent enzyme [Anaerolineales bacterium]|nr:aminotransferase class V-fold PLP-dependent enzyme [Anaerolineales bacterium]